MQEGVETKYGISREDGIRPMLNDIVRANGQPLDSGRNDREIGLAYVAGFFDGEGSIGVYPRRDRRLDRPNEVAFFLSVSASQTVLEPIQLILDTLGVGWIHAKRVPKNPRWAPSWMWSATGQQGLVALQLLFPYLRLKREQARIGIEFQSTKEKPSKAGAIGGRGRRIPPERFLFEQECSIRLRELKGRN